MIQPILRAAPVDGRYSWHRAEDGGPMHHLFVWAMTTLQQWGYPGIIVLMAMESSVIPLPSELVVPPAAFWAAQGKLSFLGVIIAATVGSWLGSSLSYGLSKVIGRPLIERYGRYILIPPQKLELAEAWVAEYGTGGIFFSRLLPVVRHLISIPAGLCRMEFGRFSLMTVLGAGAWCSVLAWFGPRIITTEMFENPQGMVHAIRGQMHWIVLLVVVLFALYGLMTWMAHHRRK